jgi:hypothetical protein
MRPPDQVPADPPTAFDGEEKRPASSAAGPDPSANPILNDSRDGSLNV